ncbi:MAG: electron transfer flavoprotein subunit alpha/FixB family protein [Nevskiaceae bacterium]|jgi:electron transfer flavoprotein alpha subunit|nr:electron transfer flavoprotein subunit alpha/FixB family protein [Nevskiaceae bacterium]
MSEVLIIAEHDGARLNPSTARCVTCASQIEGARITIGLWGSGIAAIAAQAAALQGVARVLSFDAPGNAAPLAAVLAPQVAALAKAYTHVLAPSTTFGKDLLPRIAALLNLPALSDIMAVESPQRFRRPIYAGNAILTVEVDAPLVLATVRTASFQAAPAGGSAPVEAGEVSVAPPTHTRLVELAVTHSDRPDLQTARRVVSGGRALGSAEKFQSVVQDLADALGAAVGASRAAVDAGYAANDLQVGQTGKIIAPDLYIALGISGAIQHMTGIKDARTIVAINKDADAPIFEAADIGLVGDLFEIVPALRAAIQSRSRT